MCVICTAAKKRHMKRAEVLQAIKNNSAGFFGFTVHDGKRKMIRTLDEKTFMEFFDDEVEDDDVWVMHARIPSRGEKSLDNVHGWDEDGILFCHNMTLTQLDDMMKRADWKNTDSEFFFRKVFMPYFRGFGSEAYKDGKLHPDIENLVKHFIGMSNKVCFIMPDNKVLCYGDWISEADRKENGETAFYASNSSYKVFERAYPAATGKIPDHPAYSAYYAADYADDDIGWAGYGAYAGVHGPSRIVPQTKADLVKLVMETISPAGLCRLALVDIAVTNAIEYKLSCCESTDDADMLYDSMEAIKPTFVDMEMSNAVMAGLEDLAKTDDKSAMTEFMAVYAGHLADRLKDNPRLVDGDVIRKVCSQNMREVNAFCLIIGLNMSFDAKSPGDFACLAGVPVFKKNKWKSEHVKGASLFDDQIGGLDGTMRAIGKLLKYVQKEEEA